MLVRLSVVVILLSCLSLSTAGVVLTNTQHDATSLLQQSTPDDDSDTDHVLSLLMQTEIQLPRSEQHVADVLRQAAKEIISLQAQLAKGGSGCPGRPVATTAVTSAAPTTPTPPTTTRAPVANYKMTFCDFEDSTNCGYTQNKVSDTMQMWTKGRNGSGSVEDHTFGTPRGSYFFIDTRKLAIWFQRESTVRMESPSMGPAGHLCIKFWYNMHGVNSQNLRVYAKMSNGRGLGVPVWTRSGPQGPDWKLGEIDLDSEYTSNLFTLVFEATTMAYYEHVFASTHPNYHETDGNTAIDDIYTFTTRCKDLPECPPGAIYKRDANKTSCYTVHTQPVTWSQAGLVCKRENPISHLVAINSKQEQQFLVNLIKGNPGYKAAGESSGFWTSGNDEYTSNFLWRGEGNPYSLSYTNWYPGQPNDVGGHQDCLLLQYPDVDYQWGDVECSDSRPFICEINLSPSV